MKLIGYQGTPGGCVEEAANNLAMLLNLKDYKLIPLITSKRVFNELSRNKINYGVTLASIHMESIQVVATYVLNLTYCLFAKSNVKAKDITRIAGRPYELRRTRASWIKQFPNVYEMELNNPADAARDLYEGTMPETTAVLCSYDVGDMYELNLLCEDSETDSMKFQIFKLRGD